MNIIKVIVDKLPESACHCSAAETTLISMTVKAVDCRFTLNTAFISHNAFISQRCPRCPLVEAVQE